MNPFDTNPGTPSVHDFAPDLSLGNLSFDPIRNHETQVAGILRSDAEREYESSGFSRRMLREIIHDLRDAGHRPGAIIVPADGTDLFDGQDLHRAGECTEITGVTFHGWDVVELHTDGVLDGEAFVIGENALAEPRVAPVPVLVRHPSGVAHYRFGGE